MERSDGARRPVRQAGVTQAGVTRAGVAQARGDGLAPVTYLPGVRVDAPSDRSLSQVPAPVAETPIPVTETPVAPDSDSAAEIEAAARADARAAQKAERISMNALTRRGMSKREVERSLRARDLDDETVASELDRLEGVGLIDDMALAQNLVGILQERKGLGRSAIAAELTRRLLTPAAIEYALELIESSDELGRAREIAVKRASQLRSYDRETAVRRLSAFLMRRGYSGSTVRAAVEHALPSTPASRVRFQ